MGVAYERSVAFYKPPHAHDRIILVFPRQGCTMRVEARQLSKVWVVTHDSGLVIPAGLEHDDRATSVVYDTFALLPNAELLTRTVPGGFPEGGAVFRRSAWLDALLGEYFAERVVSRQTTGNRNEALERLLLLEAHQLASSPAAATTGAPPLGPSSVTARVLRFLEANLFARVDLMEVARAAGASRSSVLRHFRRDVGLSPMAYVQGRRLDEARRLLGRTRMDVREVATMVGYANAGAFSEAYRRRFGYSPSSDGTG